MFGKNEYLKFRGIEVPNNISLFLDSEDFEDAIENKTHYNANYEKNV